LKFKHFGVEVEMSTMHSSKMWNRLVVNNGNLNAINSRLSLISVNRVAIGTNILTGLSIVFINQVDSFKIDDKATTYTNIGIFQYPPENKNAQELLLYWVHYQCQIGEQIFIARFTYFSTLKLQQHYLVFTDSSEVKVVDLNSVKEIVRINFGKVKFQTTTTSSIQNKYVMKFIVTSDKHEESEVLIASDTAIKSPSHAKITELTEDQYLTMQREKLFKR